MTAITPMRTPSSHDKLLAFRKATNAVMLGLCTTSALVAVCALVCVLLYLVVNGASDISWHLLSTSANQGDETVGGLKNSIVGSVVLILVASIVGLPVGIMGGIYQLESKGRFAEFVRFLTDVLNSVPSIIIGIFVFTCVVIPIAAHEAAMGHRPSGQSAIAGGLALSLIMIPTIMRTTEEILRLVPTSLREGSLALGATRRRTMISIILPAARSGIITGIMLALARIAGETAPLLFTAGGSDFFNTNITQKIDSLPTRIYSDVLNGDEFLRHQAMGAALILIVLIFMFSLITRLATSSKLLEEK